MSKCNWSMEEAQAWVNSHKSLLERYERALASQETVEIEDLEETEEVVETKEHLVTCPKCSKRFDYNEQPEVAMGAVKCPFCDAVINQEGELVAEKEEEKADDEEGSKYTCECIKCGHTIETDEHCKDVECPKCQGEMRRAERPGPGRSIEADEVEEKGVFRPGEITVKLDGLDAIQKIHDQLVELKEGRILSTANRAFVKGVADHTYEVSDELKATGDRLMELYNATEPPGKAEIEEGKQLVEIEDTKEKETVNVVDTKKEEVSDLTPEQIGEIVEVAITKALSEGKIADAIKDGQALAIKKLTGAVE